MLSCINKKSVEYLSLKDKANIPGLILDSLCRRFLELYDRFPNLDELDGVDSEPHLRNLLKLKENGSTDIQHILDTIGVDTIEEAMSLINNEYRDLEVNIVPIISKAIVEIKHRPTRVNENNIDIQHDSKPNNFLVFNLALYKLANQYGIKFNEITSLELESDKWKGLIKEGSTVNAFVYNGEIYINTDTASVDAPVHEMMHLLLGGLRFSNPKLYSDLVKSVENWEGFDALTREFPNRTRSDIDEEIFVREVSKLITGRLSYLDRFPNKMKYEIFYNTMRVLDSILMGNHSVTILDTSDVTNMSLKLLAQEVQSDIMLDKFSGTFNVENSALHRKLNNIKSDLLKNNLLVEECN